MKSNHPFHSTNLPNSFYFVRTHPDQYDPAGYFRTFTNTKLQDKVRYHRYWLIALDILLNCEVQKFKDNAKRLQACWNSPSKGLGSYWSDVEESETSQDTLERSRERVRKCSIRCAENSILGAIDDIDTGEHYWIFTCE
jgi:hypothetical protein